MRSLALGVLVLSSSLFAQERERPWFRVGVGFAGGEFDYRTDNSPLDDDTDGALFRLEFEAIGRRGLGGGLRIEGISSDDDLFVGAGFPASEASSGTFYGHFTYRLEEHRFVMPIRIGLLFNGLEIEENVSGESLDYGSIGPYFELEPEVTLARSGRTAWTLYGELGVGAAYTVIDSNTDSNDYDSSTGFLGLEFGTRLLLNKVELSLAYVGRFQSTDDSDPENGLFVRGNDIAFQGLFFGVGVVF